MWTHQRIHARPSVRSASTQMYKYTAVRNPPYPYHTVIYNIHSSIRPQTRPGVYSSPVVRTRRVLAAKISCTSVCGICITCLILSYRQAFMHEILAGLAPAVYGWRGCCHRPPIILNSPLRTYAGPTYPVCSVDGWMNDVTVRYCMGYSGFCTAVSMWPCVAIPITQADTGLRLSRSEQRFAPARSLCII